MYLLENHLVAKYQVPQSTHGASPEWIFEFWKQEKVTEGQIWRIQNAKFRSFGTSLAATRLITKT